jgi:putative peptide zinc metalloprotease protein
MPTPLFSPHWYRIADLRPKLRRDADLHIHRYRGRAWYVLEDRASGRSHRLTEAACHLLGLMDGRRSVDEIWQSTEDKFGDAAPTQQETIELLSQLHAADLLHSNVSPAIEELLRRFRSGKTRKWKQRLMNPLAVRMPLFDPNDFLDRTIRYARPFLTRGGFAVWLTVVASAGVLAASHWSELSGVVLDELITPRNLLLVWLCYPIVKLLHEFGHAYAAKRWDCEIHEMGVMFLVFIPVPYVDASTSAALPERYRRLSVAAMGIMVELFVAALAFFVWTVVEPGAVRTLAFSIMLISGASTLMFNGNPLLRFDGYYVLADLIDIPNLASRSRQYAGYLVRRYVFGVPDAQSPVMIASERAWLAAYAVSAFAYRMVIMFVIILYVASEYLVIGMVLAAWATVTQILLPTGRQIALLVVDPHLARRRARVLGMTAAGLAVAVSILFVLPAPLYTRTDGVVWAPDESEVRAAADAVVEQLIAVPNRLVEEGEPLLLTDDPDLAARIAVLDAELLEARARYNSLRSTEQVDAEIVLEEVRTIEAKLVDARQRFAALTIRSPTRGVFLIDRPQDFIGRYLRKGELVGFVADLSRATVRVAVTQDDIGLIRANTERVDLHFAGDIGKPVEAHIRREVPAASHRIPSAALGVSGGGVLAVSPDDPDGTRTIETVFHVELDVERPVERIGARTYVRFAHGYEPIGRQWFRRFRQLLLRQFDA